MDAPPGTGRRAELLERFERATELPLVVLAVLMVPLLVLPLVTELPDAADSALVAADWAIWVVFAVEYVVRFSLTTSRWAFVRREWADLLIVLLPFLRPLRITRSARALRLLRLARLTAIVGVIEKDGRRLARRSKLHYAVGAGLVVLLLSALIVHAVEAGQGGQIDSLGDALWWAIATVTTVGYGDAVPVTPAGRAVAAFLMLSGIALFGVVTANLAAVLVEHDQDAGPDDLASRIDELSDELRALRTAVERLADR